VNQYRVLMVRIGGEGTLASTIQAKDKIQAINQANITFGSHFKLVHIGRYINETNVSVGEHGAVD